MGRNGIIAYTDTNGDMKVYNHGEVITVGDTLFNTRKLNVSGTPPYVVTDNLLVCNANTVLKVFYADVFITLDTFYRYEGLPRCKR